MKKFTTSSWNTQSKTFTGSSQPKLTYFICFMFFFLLKWKHCRYRVARRPFKTSRSIILTDWWSRRGLIKSRISVRDALVLENKLTRASYGPFNKGHVRVVTRCKRVAGAARARCGRGNAMVSRYRAEHSPCIEWSEYRTMTSGGCSITTDGRLFVLSINFRLRYRDDTAGKVMSTLLRTSDTLNVAQNLFISFGERNDRCGLLYDKCSLGFYYVFDILLIAN